MSENSESKVQSHQQSKAQICSIYNVIKVQKAANPHISEAFHRMTFCLNKLPKRLIDKSVKKNQFSVDQLTD